MNDSVFRQRISSIMTDNMYERRVRGRTRGNLDMRSLYKVSTGSRNVFTEKMAKKGKQYNIVLLVDESGSMGNPGWGAYKIDKAAECAGYLTEAFGGLNINVAVVGFNKTLYHHKKFGIKNDVAKMKRQIEDRANGDDYDQFRDQLGEHPNRHDIACNHDFDAIAEAYKMLYNMKGTNLVIALSDGRPNCDDCSSREYDQDKHRISRIKALIHDNERVAKTIGIGVLYDAEQFPNRILVNNIDDLKTELSKVLKKEIKRV
jgi:cobalamin biosynthesis protein CobT